MKMTDDTNMKREELVELFKLRNAEILELKY